MARYGYSLVEPFSDYRFRFLGGLGSESPNKRQSLCAVGEQSRGAVAWLAIWWPQVLPRTLFGIVFKS
jgi:hypothetical protein